MESGFEDVAPQFRERTETPKTKSDGSRKKPDSHDTDTEKAALPGPDTKSQAVS